MARGGIAKLKDRQLKTSTPGMLSDGGNLYLQVTKGQNGAIRRSWIFRYVMPGERQRDLGLGGLDSTGLAQARKLAKQARELLVTGVDPIEHRNEERAKAAATLPVPTFDEVAQSYITAHRASWRNPVHAKQWPTSLKTYVSPIIGKLPVNLIGTDHVMKVLEPIWHDKTDTAKRVRGRIETVLNYATVRKFRHGDNPARWDGYLSELLARPSRLAPVQHHAALNFKAMGEFMAQLRQRDGIGPLALDFTVLTCARTAETLGATWDEIDLDEGVWTVPANRIKAGKEHRVPLAKPALAVLHKARAMTEKIGGKIAKSDFVFPNDLAELALAHKVADKVEAAYRRGTMFEKRRKLAEAWASYCAKPVAAKDGKIIPMRSAS